MREDLSRHRATTARPAPGTQDRSDRFRASHGAGHSLAPTSACALPSRDQECSGAQAPRVRCSSKIVALARSLFRHTIRAPSGVYVVQRQRRRGWLSHPDVNAPVTRYRPRGRRSSHDERVGPTTNLSPLCSASPKGMATPGALSQGAQIVGKVVNCHLSDRKDPFLLC